MNTNERHPSPPAPSRGPNSLIAKILAVAATILLFGCGGKSSTKPPAVTCGGVGTVCTVMGDGQLRADPTDEGKGPLDISFYYPIDLLFDASGRLVIMDWNNQRVRRLDFDGKVRTIVGTGYEDTVRPMGSPALETSLHHCFSIAYDDAGNLYLAGYHVPWILRVDPQMLVWVYAGIGYDGYDGDGGPAIDASMGAPTGLTIGRSGAPLIFTDTEYYSVRSIDAGGIIHTIAGDGSRSGPDSVDVVGDGGPAVDCTLNSPVRVRLDEASGNIYVCDTYDNRVRKIDPSGIITTVAGNGHKGYSGDGVPAVSTMLNQPGDAQIGPDGLLYIADTYGNRIRRVDANGNIETIAGTGNGAYSGDGGPAVDAEFDHPFAFTFGPDGNLYVADTFNSVIRKIVMVAP
jgi:hypothetical protein